MQNIILFLVILICLFGPMTLFVVFGHKAITSLGKRPSDGGRAMIPFLIKIIGASMGSVIILMILLKVFGPGSEGPLKFQYRDFDWHLVR